MGGNVVSFMVVGLIEPISQAVSTLPRTGAVQRGYRNGANRNADYRSQNG